MKEKTLVYLSLTISIAAFCYAAWVHQHAAQFADKALHDRELQLVQKFAPRFRDMYQGLGMTNLVANPTTLDELVGPWMDAINRMGETPAGDETNSAATNVDMINQMTDSPDEVKTNKP